MAASVVSAEASPLVSTTTGRPPSSSSTRAALGRTQRLARTSPGGGSRGSFRQPGGEDHPRLVAVGRRRADPARAAGERRRWHRAEPAAATSAPVRRALATAEARSLASRAAMVAAPISIRLGCAPTGGIGLDGGQWGAIGGLDRGHHPVFGGPDRCRPAVGIHPRAVRAAVEDPCGRVIQEVHQGGRRAGRRGGPTEIELEMPRTLVHSPLPIAEGHQETHCGHRRLQVVLGEVGGTEHGGMVRGLIPHQVRVQGADHGADQIRAGDDDAGDGDGGQEPACVLGRPRRRRTRMTTTASVGMKKNSQVLMEPKTEPTQSTAKTCSGS